MSFYRTKDLLSIFQDDDSLSSDGFLRFACSHSESRYVKRDFLYRSGTWRRERVNALIRDRSKSANVLILGHSDIYTKFPDLLVLKALGIRYVYATNCAQVPNMSCSLPLGLTNLCDDSPDHLVLGQTSPFTELLANSTEQQAFQNSILLSFNTNTAKKYRQDVYDLFLPNADTNSMTLDYSINGRLQYLKAVNNHDFVLCPRGNGRDTHRLWESLYLGSIPIVKSGDLPRKLLEKFPVWIVSNWAEALDPDRRATVRSDILSRDWDVRWLRQSFWNSMISSKINS
jgi:hypothetical protein